MGEAPDKDLTAEQLRALRDDIDQTREDIGATLEAIGERLSPANMVQEAVETARESLENVRAAASERVSDLADRGRDGVEAVRRRVGRNPGPAALTVLALGCIAYKAIRRNGSNARSLDERWREVQEVGRIESARQRLNATRHQTADRVTRHFRQNALAVSAAGAAIGVAVMWSLREPGSPNRVLSQTPDAALDSTREAFQMER